MRFSVILFTAPLLMLAACDFKAGGDDGKAASISIGATANASGAAGTNRVAIDAPGFKASVDVPGLRLAGDDMDIDGMTLAPGTRVTGMNIVGEQRGAGRHGDSVRMALTSPQPPAAQIAYYRRAAAAAGYSVSAPAGAGPETVLTMTKTPDKTVRIALHPQGAGSAGSVTITGD